MITALALMCAFHHQACKFGDATIIAKAVDNVVTDERLKSLVVTYIGKESWFQIHPKGESWDAKALVSCGILQMPCEFVRHSTLEMQVTTWLKWVAQSSLASVDSDPVRAWKRARLAERILEKARANGTSN